MERLNFKTNNYRDLLSDEPFARMDVITIQVMQEMFDSLFFIVNLCSIFVEILHFISLVCTIFVWNISTWWPS